MRPVLSLDKPLSRPGPQLLWLHGVAEGRMLSPACDRTPDAIAARELHVRYPQLQGLARCRSWPVERHREVMLDCVLTLAIHRNVERALLRYATRRSALALTPPLLDDEHRQSHRKPNLNGRVHGG